jgi:hypothetical protein
MSEKINVTNLIAKVLNVVNSFSIGGTKVTATAAELNTLDGILASTAELNTLDGILASTAELNLLAGLAGKAASAEVTFTETTGAGTYTGSVTVPAGVTLLDIIVNGVALWTATTSAAMIVGDAADPNGYFGAVDLKATDLLAGESLSFALAGGEAGAYIANSQVSPRYSASARVITGEVTTVGAAGNAGRTRMVVIWSEPVTTVAAVKA